MKLRRFWILTTSIAAVLLAALIFVVRYVPHLLVPIDASVLGFLAPFQTQGVIEVFLAITALGGGVGIIAVALGFGSLAHLPLAQLARLTFVLTGAAVASRVIKAFTERLRPETLPWFETLPSFSFPSAHAAGAFTLYGFIAAFFYSHGQRMLAAVMLVVAMVIGLSRVVLGVHHFSDVIGGVLLGILLLAIAFALPFERITRRYE